MIIKKIFYFSFRYLSFFYRYLGNRIFIALGLSLMVGILDGVGIAMFIPLLKMLSAGEISSVGGEGDFISEFVIEELGISASFLNIFFLILIFFSLKGIAKFLESYTRVIFQQKFIRSIRINTIDLLNTYDFIHFLKADSGRIQNTLGGEVNRINSAYKFYFKAIQFGVLVLVYLMLALASDWKFTLFVVTGGVLINIIFRYLYQRTKYFSQKYTRQSHIFQNLLVQNVHFFKYLKATGTNIFYGNKLKENIGGMEKTQKKIGVVDAFLGAIREPLTILVVFGAIFFHMYFFDEVMGSILLSLLLLYRGITFFMAMQEQFNYFLGVSGSLENMEAFTRELQKSKERNGLKQFVKFRDRMEMKNLSFEFEKGNPVLQNIDLTICKNETLAIIGESGSGKSTLLNIISGLLFLTKGSYVIDGEQIEELDLASFKSRIGYIVQDATIFNDTIYNNVSFWDPKTPDNLLRFQKAIEKSAILDFIEGLPEKEETMLGSNGINISGGQKQRLSIARELYKEVDILLMDEATSALDGETEAAIQDNINNLKGEFTIVIIAHRLSTVKSADRIILLNNGEIDAEGNFNELLEKSNQFKEMVHLQNL